MNGIVSVHHQRRLLSSQAKQALTIFCMHGECIGPSLIKGEAFVASQALNQLEMTMRISVLFTCSFCSEETPAAPAVTLNLWI